MRRTRVFNSLCAVMLGATAALLLASSPVHAQGTSSSIRIIVTDASGNAVGGIPVAITHEPTGRTQIATTTASGVVTARGLAVGGPYTVNVASNSGYTSDGIADVMLELDETEVIDLGVRAVAIEEIVVVASQMVQELRTGVGTDFGSAEISATPSIARDFVSVLATEPKILVDNSVARGPAVSMAGQNFRFNSVTIDGVAQNDNFGLSKNASATQRTPISIDAIEAINVNIAPYDVTYGNFIGGNINIVTKSGTNELAGSAFYTSTSDSMTGNKSKGVDLEIGDFDEKIYGFTLGGPIIKDQLFFFVNYEKFETTVPSNTQTIANIAGVTQADVDRVRSVIQTEYGFDPGPFAASDDDQDEKILVKLDWHINDNHRAVATYQVADGDVLFDDFPEVAVLQSNRYNINEKLTSFSAQVFSNWTDRLSTEFKIGTKDVENRQISVDTVNPDFTIFTAAGGTIAAGGDRFRHTNELDNESRLIKLKADYDLGNHLFTVGFEQEEYTIRNLFLPFSKGNYNFFSIDDLENRALGFLLYGNSNSGVATDAEANFDLAVNSFYLQDEWTVNDALTLKFGIRFDKYDNSDAVPENPAFTARNGFSNGTNLDGKDLVLPRFGFNWAATDRLTLRGGAGLFGGGVPLIMLANSYSGNGVTRTFAGFFINTGGADPAIDAALDAAVLALPDPDAAFDNFQQFTGFSPDVDVDALASDFDILSTWKYSIGAEYVFGDDWYVSGDIVFTDVNDGYNIFEGRRVQAGTAPDGRPIYDFPAGADYIVTNTSQGDSTVITVSLDKAFDTNFGLWDVNVGYANQNVDELRSYNRFVGFETYAFDAQTDLNNGQVASSKYEVEHRITANLRWQKELFGNNVTSVGLTYAGRSGRHYSYVLGSANAAFGGNFLADFGSEGDNPGPMLFYVPTGTSDPLVTGDAAFLADLDTFISGESCLNKSRGSIARRNDCETDWVNIVSLTVQQEINFGRTAFDVFLNIENFGNLINDDWGRIDSYTAPSNVSPATVAIDAVNNQYIYTANASYNGTPESVTPRPAIARLPSAYRVQLGVRFRF